MHPNTNTNTISSSNVKAAGSPAHIDVKHYWR